MSNTEPLHELTSLRSQVADLVRELTARDQAQLAQQKDIDGELQDLREQSDLLRAIMEDTAADMGDDFFASLATHLTSTLHIQYAVIGEIFDGTPARIRTLAVSSGGTLLENFEYDLAEAPCGTGLTESFWCFTQGVQTLFPNFPPLAAMRVESHSGVAIRNHQGKVVGLIVVMDTKPIASQDRLQTLLKVFAPRAAAELHRKHAEDEHRQALHELQNIMETVPDFMFTLDTQGNLVKWNRRVEEVTGYSREELHGKSALAFVPAQEQEQTALAIQRAVTDGYAELKGYLLTKDHRTIPYHWAGAALKDPQGRIIGITGIGRDVSEQKRAAESLHRQQQHLQEAQALAHLGSWEWDIERGETAWSDEQFRIFGYEPGTIAVTYDTFLAALLPDDHDRVLAAINDALLGKCLLNVECRIVRPNGDIRVIHMRADVQRDATAHPIGMAGTALDITERKQTEEALRVSEERWHLAVQGSNDGIWDWNIQTGEIFFSARWKTMRGFGDEEVRNHIDEWRSRIHPDDLDRVLQSIDHYLAKQTSAFCEEYRVQRKDGSYMWILDRGIALWADDGTPVRMAGSETDITDRKLAEELLHKSVMRFDLAMQGSRDGLWYAERVSDNLFAPHNPIYYSPRMKEIMGVGNAAMPDVLGTWLSLVHPDDLPTVLAALTQHLEERLPYDVEYRIYQYGTGTLRWIGAKGQAVWDSSGQPIRMAGSFSDITERKRAEHKLSLTQYTVDHAIDAFYWIGLQAKILDVNEAASLMLGYTRDELLAMSMHDLNPGFQADRWPGFWAESKQQGTMQLESTHRTKAGRLIPVEIQVNHLTVEGKELHCAYVRDITERKRAEGTLQTSQEKLQQALRASHTGLWDWNTNTNETSFSREWKHQLGYEETELADTFESWESLLHPEDHDRVIGYVRAYLANPKDNYQQEFRLRHKDGSYRWIEARAAFVNEPDGRQVRLLGSHTDITERKNAELALRDSEARTRSILETALDAVVSINDCGLIIGWNPQAEDLFGYSPHEVLGRPLDETVIPARYRQAHAHGMNRMLQSDDESVMKRRFEFFALHRSGQEFPVEFAIAASQVDGEPMFTAFIRDITERKRAEVALRESEERYRTLVELSPSGVFVFCEGRTVYVNSMAMTILGATEPNDILARAPFEFIHPDYHEDVTKNLHRVLAGEATVHRAERVYLKLDGTPIHVQVEAVRIIWNGKPAIQGFFSDITDRKLAEQALATSECQLRTVLDSLPIGVWFTDEKGQVLYGNPVGHRIWADAARVGLPQPEGDGLWWETIAQPEAPHRWAVGKVLVRREDLQNETLAIEMRAGECRWIRNSAVPVKSDTGEVLGAIVLNEDITDRVCAENALLQKHALLMAVMDAATDIIFVKDLEGRYIHINRAGAHTLGMPVEEVIGWNDYAIWPSDLATSCQLADRRVLETGETVTVEETSVCDGITTIYLTTKAPYRNSEGQIIGVIGVARDITEQKQAEEALRASEQLFAKAFRASPNPIGVTEMATGRCIDTNQACLELFGFSREEVVGQTTLMLGIWPNPKDRDMLISRLQASGPIHNEEMTFSTKSGTHRHVLVSSDLVEMNGMKCLITVGNDITERIRAEEDLRRSHAFIRQIIDTDPNFIFAKDREGRFTLVNKAIAEAYGTTVERLIGKTDADFNSNMQELEFFRNKDLEVLDSLREQFIAEEMLTDAAGHTRWLQTVKRPILDESGQATLVLGASTDITERKRMEEALRQRERDLRTALDERERISQDLHDGILQSLYAIGLGLEACKPLMTQRHYKKAATSMDRAIGQLNHVMSEVRNFIAGLESQILQGSTFPIALRTMVQTLTAPHPIPCTLTIDETLDDMFSTEQTLHLLNVVREALSNSFRHAEATKTTVSLKSLSRSIRLTIADNGKGFDPASLRGAGHGLTNMEARARKIGGQFAIRSVPQHGTRITIDLPKRSTEGDSPCRK